MNTMILGPIKTVFVNKNNFIGHGWEIEQVNTNPGGGTTLSNQSNHVGIRCGPRKPRSKLGSVLLSLPKSIDSTLRRVRLRNSLHSKTRVDILRVLKYSTYITHNVNNSAPDLALQIDTNNDTARNFNIFFDPSIQHDQNNDYPIVMQNTWQEWDALNGFWGYQGTVPPHPNLPEYFTLETLLNIPGYSNARMINTSGGANEGGCIRLTVGGDTSDFDDFVGYVDGLIIGTFSIDENMNLKRKAAIRYDFVCDRSIIEEVSNTEVG